MSSITTWDITSRVRSVSKVQETSVGESTPTRVKLSRGVQDLIRRESKGKGVGRAKKRDML